MEKIIYTGSFRFPEGDAAAHRVLSIGKIYQVLGYEVIYAGWEKYKDDNLKWNKLHYQGFDYISQNELDKPSSRNYIKKIFDYMLIGSNTLKWLSTYVKINKIDRIVVYNTTFIFLVRMRSFCKKHDIKLIADCTEWYESSHLPGGKYGLVSLDNYLKMHFGIPNANNLILISDFLKKFYDKKKCNTIKIPPLIDNSTNIHSVLPFPDSNNIAMIYAGSPGKKDNIIDIINVLNKKPAFGKIIFNIVGVSKKQFCAGWPNINVPENVRFNGRVEHEKVREFYSQSDFSIIIRPQLRYANAGFPTKFVESLSFGVPVITTNTSDLKDYIVDGNNGYLLASDDEKSIESVFLKIVNLSRSEIERMKIEAAKTSKRFNYSNYINEFKEFNERID